MFKKSLIALAALGLAGALTVTSAPTPAEAGLFCGPKATAKPGSWCQRAAERRAKRRHRWKAFWGGRRK